MSTTTIRPALAADLPFLYSGFAQFHCTEGHAGAWRSAPQTRGVPLRVMMAKMEALAASPDWRFDVLCPTDLIDEIMGALLWKPHTPMVTPTIGWIFVKPIYRRKGVARALLQNAGIRVGEVHCAFLDPVFAKEAATKGWRLRFRPYLPDVALWDASKARAA